MLLSLRYLLSSTGKNKCGQPPVPNRYGRLFCVPALCNRYGKTWAVIYLQLKNRLRILKINIKRVDFFGEKRYNNKLVGKEV